jgi:hypothetical protein
MRLSDLPEGTVVFKIARTWRPDLSEEELYEATRGNWRVAEQRRQRGLRMAIGYAKGAIRSAYEIDAWEPSEPEPGRVRFIGRPTADELIGQPIPEIDNVQTVAWYVPKERRRSR